MKFNKPVLTTILIIILLLDFFLFSITIVTKKTLNKDNALEIVHSFDYKAYLMDDENIKQSIDNYSYSKEIFDYIKKDDVISLEDKLVDNLYSYDEEIIRKKDILLIMNDAVDRYESEKTLDIHNYIDNDIDKVSSDIVSLFNENTVMSFNFINKIVSSAIIYVFVFIATVLTVLIMIFEKRKGYLINGILYLIYSVFVYYISKVIFTSGFINDNIIRYFKYFSTNKINLDMIYIVCFVFGFILILIYFIGYLKRTFRDMRLGQYY